MPVAAIPRLFVAQGEFAENRLLVVLSLNNLYILDASSGACLLSHSAPATFRCGTLCTIGKRGVLAAAAGKEMLVFASSAQDTRCWVLVARALLRKKVTCCVFGARELDGNGGTAVELLCGDKFGDVYAVDRVDDLIAQMGDAKQLQEGDLLLRMGHVSSLTHMISSPSGKFVVTCDRDEKIRVSNYPNLYDVHSFCMGHKKLISRLSVAVFEGHDYLISGSADGTLRLWDPTDAKCLQVIQLNQLTPQSIEAVIVGPSTSVVALCNEQQHSVLLYQLLKEHGKTVQLKELQVLNVGVEVLDLCFANVGHSVLLFVLTASAPHVRLFQLGAVDLQLVPYQGNEIAEEKINSCVAVNLADQTLDYLSSLKKKGDSEKYQNRARKKTKS